MTRLRSDAGPAVVRNVSARPPDDPARRASLIDAIARVLGHRNVMISDGDARFIIPLDVYLQHVSFGTLESGLCSIKRQAMDVVHVLGRFDICRPRDGDPQKEILHLVERGAGGPGWGVHEGAFDLPLDDDADGAAGAGVDALQPDGERQGGAAERVEGGDVVGAQPVERVHDKTSGETAATIADAAKKPRAKPAKKGRGR